MIDLVTRLDRKITTGPGCWEWTGAKHRFGYGLIKGTEGVCARAHRLVYELLVGPIPAGLELDHLCGNKGCVNPDHVEPVTHQENMRRSSVGWNFRRGAKDHGARHRKAMP